jgi:hypothetical protein
MELRCALDRRSYEQVGRNTQYIIHPEEIMADNFAELVMQDRSVPTPEILQKMLAVLTGKPIGGTK